MCLMRSVYYTQYSELQEIIDKFEARRRRKCYTIARFLEILCKLDINEGDYILTWNSGTRNRFFQRDFSNSHYSSGVKLLAKIIRLGNSEITQFGEYT